MLTPISILVSSLALGDAAPILPRDVEAAVERGVTILIERQESLDDADVKGEWPYEGVYRVVSKKGAREIPIGYRVGGTAIVAGALLDCARSSKEVDAAIERALDFVLAGLEAPSMSSGFEDAYDVRGWGHAYALAFLLRLRELERVPRTKKSTVDAKITDLVRTLQATEITGGGWNYSRPKSERGVAPSTFMTASTLLFLFEAAEQGEEVDGSVVDRALDTLESARLESGAFQYASRPAAKSGEGFEDVPGAIGRMPVCEVTLHLAGRGSVERVRSSLAAFFEHWEWLEKRRKQPGTHVAPYMIAPYYFFYAHRHAAQAIELLPDAERASWREKLRALLWKVREESGGWNDRVFARSESFGTAMTLLALTEPKLARPATWNGTTASSASSAAKAGGSASKVPASKGATPETSKPGDPVPEKPKR